MCANMILNLTDYSNESLQSQIIRQVREQILSGAIPPDFALPSIRALAREQSVSVITVQRAYEALEGAGFIYSRRGKGFFAAPIENPDRRNIAESSLSEKLVAVFTSALNEGIDSEKIIKIAEEVLLNVKKNL